MLTAADIHDAVHAENIAALKRAVTESGSYFFTRNAMRAWGTRAVTLHSGYLVIGCDSQWDGPDKWWARVFTPASNGMLLDYLVTRETTKAEALRMARAYIDLTICADAPAHS